MKHLLIFALLSLMVLPQIKAQNKAETIIQGGQLVLDFFKKIKNKKSVNISENHQNTNTSDENLTHKKFCVYNPTETRVSIELSKKENGITSLICNSTVPTNDSTCCLGLINGIYHIKIVEACSNPIKIIKEGDVEYSSIDGFKIIIK